MSHQAFAKSSGTIPDGYVLKWSSSDGYWKPGSLPLGGWTTAYDVDFRTVTPQTITGDGPFTVSGKSWNMVNYANVDSVIINSSGLTIDCNGNSTDFATSTRSAPMVTLNLSNVITNYDPNRHVVRVWTWISANNADADFEMAFLSLDRTQGTAPINRMLHMYKKGNVGSLGGLIHYGNGVINNSSQGDIASTTNYSDDVLIIQQDFPGSRFFQCLSGVYDTGNNTWPSISNLTFRWNYFMNYGTPATVLNMTESATPFKVSLGAQTVNTTNTLVVTFARIKIEYLDIGTGPGTSGNAGGDLVGTYPNPTVNKIQGNSVSSSSPVDGQYLKYNSSTSSWTPTTIGTTLSRRVTPDGYSQLVWKFDDLVSPFVNSGVAGSLDASTGYGSPVTDSIGIFNRCVDFQNSGLKTADTSLGESDTLTVSVWTNLRSFGTNQDLYDKKYQTGNTWTAPFVSHGIGIANSSGQWFVSVTIGGSQLVTTMSTRYALALNQWQHLGFTYDASTHTLKTYINGRLATTDTSRPAGSIDYGSHGSYQIGAVTTQSTQGIDGRLDDLRIENTIRSDSYFESLYKAGIASYDTLNTQSSSGASTNRPTATGSGALYLADDINVLYIDNPTTNSWKSYHTMGYSGTAPTAASLTVVGTMGLLQKGDSILASTQVNNKDHHALTTIPVGVTATGPWVLTISGTCSFTRGATYPSFGCMISNGVTASSSTGLFWGYYQFNSNTLVPGAWILTLNTQTRPAVYYGDNTNTADSLPLYFRIINDGTNYIYQQAAIKGAFWRTLFTNTTATVGITPTHYGFSLGCVNGSGYAAAQVDGLSIVTISQSTITNVTSSGGLYTVTTSGAHGLITGDSVSITSVTGTGTSPNARYENTVIFTGTNTFTVPAGGAFTYTSGGLVTLTSR